MTQTSLHSTPRQRDVFIEQVRVVGLALRWPAVVASALLALATLLLATEIVREGKTIAFHPERWILPALVGLLLPIIVWKGQERFGDGFLWTLPVDRRRHALARVFAGWVWLMGGVGLFVLWLLVLAVVSGGNIVGEETLRILPASFVSDPPRRLDPAVVPSIPWTPEPWLWLVPFTAAMATYLLATAMALGARHLWRWLLAPLLAVVLIGTIGEVANLQSLRFMPSRLLASFLYGPYGLARLLTAGTDFGEVRATLTTGETVLASQGLPDVGRWAPTTLLWIGAGLIAVWAAASRHRERRRA